MTRTENDLRDALRELERLADQHGAPSAATLTGPATDVRPAAGAPEQRFPRWLAPLAAAAVVAGAAVTAAVLSSSGSGDTAQRRDTAPGGRPTAATVAPAPASTSAPVRSAAPPSAATILNDAAAEFDAVRTWTPPQPQDFFYVRSTEATTWTSVSGTRAGDGRTASGSRIWVSGCRDGQIVSSGEAGPCTLNDVPHYLGDAPTVPSAWDAYLERMAPGAKAGGAQGKIIVQVLHQDLTAPKATAALLRYTASCPGLRLVAVEPVAREKLTGVTCTSMAAGSYGLAFDAATHRLVGFVGLGQGGVPDGPAEIIQQAGIVSSLGRTP